MGQQGLSSRAVIGQFYEALDISKDRLWPFQLGMEFPSNQDSETYKWLGFSPAMREWVGGRQAKGLRENGITIENKLFESTLELDVDDIRRDKTGQINVRIAEMADRVNSHWASLLTALILSGASQVCYDGQYFFDTDHQEGDSGAQKNKLTAAEVPTLDVATATAPTPDEFAKAILGCIQQFYGLKDDQGEPMNEGARVFRVMVPIALWAAAIQALRSNFLSTGTGVRDNILKGVDLDLDVIPNPRLTAGTVFYIFRVDGRAKPFILQNEVDVKVEAVAEGSEHEFKNRKHLYGVSAMRNVGYGYWQHALHATLS